MVSSGGPSDIMTIKMDTWSGKSWIAKISFEKDGSKTFYWEKMEGK